MVVRGPAAALVATVSRMGWTVVDAMHVVTIETYEFNSCLHSPGAVKRAVQEAVGRWRWKQADAGMPGLLGPGKGEVVWELVAKLIDNGWTI